MRLLLLPGMDGTEILFGPLRRSLPGHLDVEALRYPQRGPSDYGLLLTTALATIAAAPPETRFVVLGWSFGGPLAMRIARLRPSRVRALVLVSTFVSCPLPWLRRVRWLLIGPIVGAVRFMRRLPLWLLRKPSDPLRRDKAELIDRRPNGLEHESASVIALGRRNDSNALVCRGAGVAQRDGKIREPREVKSNRSDDSASNAPARLLVSRRRRVEGVRCGNLRTRGTKPDSQTKP